LVWTGPQSSLPLRRTAQALQQLIDEAAQQLLVVSYAVYDIPEIGAALARAADRGVGLRLVIESPREDAGHIAYDGLRAFGPAVRRRARVYRWPPERRPTDDNGRYGALHVKCAVADERLLLLSSANLTHYALNLNMEMGLMVRGGDLPRRVTRHFDGLISSGALELTPAPGLGA
jgi:phosphatidylserine/phosphatidylglycerophosphate/cardiolipin synthase-like enzyme